MIESSSTFQHTLERAQRTFDDFIRTMYRRYPKSKEDLGAYILIRLSRENPGTKKYQKWDGLWTQYCMYLNGKSQASTALANFHHRASILIN